MITTRWLAGPLLGIVLLAAPLSAQDTLAPARDLAAFPKLDTVLRFLRDRNARNDSLTAANAIDEGKYVRLGGIDQWITIRGDNRRNPVILFLHGGPGDVTNPWGRPFFNAWLKRFTVVQWDQRGAGRTLGRNGPSIAATVTADRMVQDGIELTELLRRTLRQDKIILVGHSWGSVLGVLMAKARPDLFYAYVGTGQVAADPGTNAAATYRDLLAEAERRQDVQAVEELQQVGPPPWHDGRGFGVQHKWALRFEHADVFLGAALGIALTAPGYSVQDINDWFDGQLLSGDRLGPHFATLDSGMGGTFAIPVVVIQGAEDFTVSTRLARTFLNAIHAPKKAFVTIPDAGHFAVFMRSDEFLRDLLTYVMPLVGRH